MWIFISFFIGLLFGILLMGLCASQKKEDRCNNEDNNNIG